MKHVTSLLLCLICWLPFGISGTPENGPERVQSEFSCNLPGPSNLAASNVGATEFDLTWSAVSGAYGYLIEVTDPNNNILYNNVIIGTSVTIANMPPGTTLTVKATTLCAVGNPGNASVLTLSTDIVIELIVGNFEGSCTQHPTNIATTPLLTGNEESFYLKRNKYYFAEFRQQLSPEQSLSTYFRIIIIDSEGNLQGEMQQVELNSPAGDLTNDIGSTIPLPSPIGLPFISYNINQNIQRIRMYIENNGGISNDRLGVVLIQSSSNSSYSFGITPCIEDEKSGEREPEKFGFTSSLKTTSYEIYPNPFMDFLIFKNNNTSNDCTTRLAIYDVNGKCLYSTNTQGNTELNTSFLKNGIYFIRIENKESVEIFKILKSE